MTPEEINLKDRIDSLVESIDGDTARSNELFQYVWTMMCVRRGLLRVVREVDSGTASQLVLEEVRTGHRRFVSRPRELDGDVEGLAVQALARIMSRE